MNLIRQCVKNSLFIEAGQKCKQVTYSHPQITPLPNFKIHRSFLLSSNFIYFFTLKLIAEYDTKQNFILQQHTVTYFQFSVDMHIKEICCTF